MGNVPIDKILKELKKQGCVVLPEVARSFIQSEKRAAARNPDYIPLLPKSDYVGLFSQVLAWKQRVSENNMKSERVFLDRSLVDIIAYSPQQTEFDDFIISQAGYTHIFLLEPVPYRTDSERQETEKEARRMHDLIRGTYERYRFSLIDVPKSSPRRRADFILNKLKGGV